VLSTLCMKPSRIRGRSRLILSYLSGLALTACLLGGGGGGGGGDECKTGRERCGCYDNDTCNDGLICLSQVCVSADRDNRVDGGGPDDDSSDGDDDPSNDRDGGSGAPAQGKPGSDGPGADASVTDDSQTDEATPIDPGPDPVTDDPDDTATDDSTTDDAVTDDSTTDDAVTDDSTTDDAVTDDSTTDDSASDPCALEDGTACWTGNAAVCVDDVPQPRDCSGCSVLSCGTACCSWISAFAARTSPYLERPELLMSFAQADGSASIDLDFDGTGNIGAIVFRLDELYDINPATISVVAAGSGPAANYISVSLEAGDSGCQYRTSGTALNTLVNCWGDFELAGLGLVNQINVRLHSTGSGGATLTVTSLSW